MHLAILCSAYASVRFVGNHTVRQDLAIELCMYKTQLLSPLTLPYKARGRGPNNPQNIKSLL
jgi:calcineurin-like phosphoesterase